MSLYPASIDKLHTYMKYLIVGLGNIGREYEATRHNIGFRIADALAARLGTSFATKRYGDVATGRIKNAQVVLLKPSTYMNLSGEAVRSASPSIISSSSSMTSPSPSAPSA